MLNAPTIVRLIRFPKTLQLSKSGNVFRGPRTRSGALVLSERHDPVDVTLRITAPGVTFETGGTTVTATEAFQEGEQRDVLLPWAVVVDQKSRIPLLLLEIDVSYSGTADTHTATVPIKLSYGVRQRAVRTAIAAVTVAAAVVAAVKKRPAKEKPAPPKEKPAPPKKKAAPPKKKAAPAKKTAAPAKKATASKKAAPSKKASGRKADGRRPK